MLETTSRELLVGVQSADCEPLLAYAAAEARRRRCGIHLLHVRPVDVGATEIGPPSAIAGELRRDGKAVLVAAKDRLAQLCEHDPIPVTTELVQGPVVSSLVHAAERATLVVLQHRGMGPTGATSVFSITHAVASYSPVPTVAVPDGWSPGDRREQAVVGVAVGEVDACAEVLRHAFEDADRRGARLRLIQAWLPWLPGSLDPDDSPDLVSGACKQAEGELGLSTSAMSTAWPTVSVELVVVPGRPVYVLVDQAADLDLLVVARRRHPVPARRDLGEVVCRVLRWSPAPVMVVDPEPSPPDDGRSDDAP